MQSFDQRRCLRPVSAFCDPDDGKPVSGAGFAVTAVAEPLRLPCAFADIWKNGPPRVDAIRS
jgi:hypothetical protein